MTPRGRRRTASKRPALRSVYFFGDGRADGTAAMRDRLGGKGANLAEMTRLGVPVPPGFTIATDVAAEFSPAGGGLPEAVLDQARRALRRVERVAGARFGDAGLPLLVSVRSGAPVSMPGMMDTVLNLGLSDRSVRGLAAQAGARFAFDSYRCLIQMYGDVVLGVPAERFAAILEARRDAARVTNDAELSATELEQVARDFLAVVRDHTGAPFPQDPEQQLWGAVGAVFRSWHNERARRYRRLHGVPESLGTAVNVQAMVFGNMGDDCATDVALTRDPGILADDPFTSIDEEGIGVLIALAAEKGRRARPELELGLCGEHGGDPKSVRVCARAGLDYVSCSPFRVPIARLAAAQAALAVSA